MGAEPLRWAAWTVSRRGEAQDRSVVLGELLQARYVSDMDAVLEVGTHGHHAGLVAVTGFPRQELDAVEQNGDIAITSQKTTSLF